VSSERKPENSDTTHYEILMRKIAIGLLVVGLSVSAVVLAMAPPEVEEAMLVSRVRRGRAAPSGLRRG